MPNVASSEHEQLERFRHGDLEAFEALFRAHQKPVYGWILRMVRDVTAAEELTVETFWRIYRAHARFDPARGFEVWARRIATNAALDWMRRRRPETAMPAEFFADLPSPRAPDPAICQEIRRNTALALGRLKPTLRVAATLAVIEERPYGEVAEAMGISVALVKVRVFRALRLLRKDLERLGITP